MAPSQTVALRRERERDLVRATRALFDERGMQDAPIEEIAKAVGIARGLIYRQFSSKDELFVLTVTDYLDELDGVLSAAVTPGDDPMAQLERWARAYAGFCLRYPAFLDCSMSLMRRPASDLHELVSESVWLRLGQGMATCIGHVSRLLQGFAGVEDPDYLANLLWTETLGMMHLARIRVGVRQAAPGIPELFTIAPERVVESVVAHAQAIVGSA
ncbi:MAG: TetR/AcrR family transcriptional regulator [Solirubrobacteraceae bacterium]